jgi:polar amino acid transport system substrate-binding protein
VWDIRLIGAEPQRAEKIAFSPAYVESTYLVPPRSPLKTVADVGEPDVRVSRSAYDLWLARNIEHAMRSEGGGGAAFR